MQSQLDRSPLPQVGPDSWLCGVDCEVSSPAGVNRLADSAHSLMGDVDIWVNNAGYCAGFQASFARAIAAAEIENMYAASVASLMNRCT